MIYTQTRIAEWRTSNGKRFVILWQDDYGFKYTTHDGFGNFGPEIRTIDQAILACEAPWGPKVGPVTVLKSDFRSVRRVK